MEVLLAVSAGDTTSRDAELQQKLKVAWIYIVSIYITGMVTLITQDILERQREFHWESLALRDKMMLPQYSYHK